MVKYWSIIVLAPLHLVGHVTFHRLPSGYPSHFTFWSNWRGLCWWSRCRCSINGHLRQKWGLATVRGTTVSCTMSIRDGSTVALRVLVSRTEKLGTDFSLASGFDYQGGWCAFLSGGFPSSWPGWLKMTMCLTYLNNRHVHEQWEHTRHRRQYWMLSSEDVTNELLLGEHLELERLPGLGCRIIITGVVFIVSNVT